MVISKQTKKLRIFIVILLIAGLLTAAGVYAYTRDNNSSPVADKEASDDGGDQSDEVSNPEDLDAINPVDDIKDTPAVDEPTGPETPEATTNTTNVEITSLNQNGNTLQIRTIIQAVDTGACTLTLSKTGSTTVTRTADTQNLSNATTCKGFDIDTSGLAKGAWQLTIDFKGNSFNGQASQEVQIS